MSAQDERNDIILECIPTLVKLLTGFEDDDVNTEHCIHFAWNIIRNHRNLSTNSHDVRRKIEGIQERFHVENCSEYADYLGRLCDEVVRHPLCVDHYEVDVHWSLLDFLFELAYNPTVALKKNKHKIEIKPAVSEEVESVKDNEKAYWLNKLKEDFIPVPTYDTSESDLSDWSDDDEEDITVNTTADATAAIENLSIAEQKPPVYIAPSVVHELRPPQKSLPYKIFDSSDAEKKLDEKIQHSWWNIAKGEHHNAIIESNHPLSNFALDYSRFLSDTSNNLIRFEEPNTIAEQHVLREILWTFQRPTNSAVFMLDANKQLSLRPNVTIPSCGVNAFQTYLENQYLPYLKMMNVLRQFHKAIYCCEDRLPPRTLECYAANLHLHLKPVWQTILDYEKRLREPKDFEVNTLVTMRSYLDESLRHLQSLYELHEKVFLDWRQHPAHITSAFLLSSLMNCYQTESSVAKGNLFMSLLLSSIKVFCDIIDTWWTDGRLDDWQQEYIVERISNSDQSVCMREYRKNKSKAFFVPTHVSKVIENNSLFQLMREHSLEAGRTLNLLYEINRIGDLRKNCDAMGGKLYNVFIEDFLKQVGILQNEVAQASGEMDVANDTEPNDSGFYNEAPNNSTNNGEKKTQSLLDCLTTTDSYLIMAFALNIREEHLVEEEEDEANPCNVKKEEKEINASSIYESLKKKANKNILPLEELLISTLSHIFKMRIAFANSFVLKLYREEFMILKHLRNIRKVMLLEASDAMHIFYSKLFSQIESGESWANRSLLTMQLDDIICSKYPDMSLLFCLEVNSAFRCQTTKVIEAVEELIVTYNFTRELSHIISPEDIKAYNKVFCFLLKVKWGITTLEKLQFARSHKRRIPYARFEMIDLIMRRLEQLRFWMIYAIQSVHFHLMTHVLQSMGEQLDEKIEKCENFQEMEMVHKSYLSTVCEHCFLTDNVNTIKVGVEQLLSLVSILRAEWLACVKFIESNNPLAISLDDSASEDTDTDFVSNSQIDAMEYTYICCHQYLANILNDQVYLKKNTFLSGLRAAFNTSLPH
ncbi:gamma-tubulin complex component 5 [Musca vetustissima]|uniref:gamma-tubulin complex component 5 n=1 Tax=Musca vetustissima TaxID=27455 RepID=UPI002AB6AE1C|nr:gamma-tubulin complex component 5 [Musca vetustissima]